MCLETIPIFQYRPCSLRNFSCPSQGFLIDSKALEKLNRLDRFFLILWIASYCNTTRPKVSTMPWYFLYNLSRHPIHRFWGFFTSTALFTLTVTTATTMAMEEWVTLVSVGVFTWRPAAKGTSTYRFKIQSILSVAVAAVSVNEPYRLNRFLKLLSLLYG